MVKKDHFIFKENNFYMTAYRYIIFLLAGGPDPEIGLNYIRELFLSKKPTDKHMYLHVTCATDTDLMKAVLKDVFEILVDINLKKLSTL